MTFYSTTRFYRENAFSCSYVRNIVVVERIIKFHQFTEANTIFFFVHLFSVSYNSYVTSMLLFSFKPILLDLVIPLNETRPHSLPFPMHWYYREEKYFSNLFLCEYFTAILLGLCVISGLSMYLIIVQHVCAMFQIIGWVLLRALSIYFLISLIYIYIYIFKI